MYTVKAYDQNGLFKVINSPFTLRDPMKAINLSNNQTGDSVAGNDSSLSTHAMVGETVTVTVGATSTGGAALSDSLTWATGTGATGGNSTFVMPNADVTITFS